MPDEKENKRETGKPASRAQPRLVLAPGQEIIYANVVRISHSPAEMVFDFGRLLPGERDAFVKSRVLMSPLSAKLLERALADNLSKYETTFGEIKIPRGKSLADDLFRSLQPPEPPTENSK